MPAFLWHQLKSYIILSKNHDQTSVKHMRSLGGSETFLTVSSRASLNRPLRLLWRKALELPVLDIRILAKRAFCKVQEIIEGAC